MKDKTEKANSSKSLLGDGLKEIRNQKQYTQKEIAEILGITERAYQRYESGERFPYLDNLVALANFYKMPFSKLLFDNSPDFAKSLPNELLPSIEDLEKTVAHLGLSRNDCLLYLFVYMAYHSSNILS